MGTREEPIGVRSRWTAEQIADGIAYVCENIPQIRATLAKGPKDGLRRLEDLLAALQDQSGDPVHAITALHRALRQAKDAPGIFGRTRDASMLTLAGINADQPAEPVLLCPRRSGSACSRYAWPLPGEPPVCHVTGAPLRYTTLTS